MKYKELAEFFHRIEELKRIYRSGWLRHKIPEPETVADHTFRVAFMAMILGDMMDADSLKLLRMALIHDLAEVMAGDITPHDGISREEKQRREEEGLRELLGDIPNCSSYIDLWREYEEQESKEAKILKNIDKLEMALTAMEYQKMSPEKDLSEFIIEAEKIIDIPEIRSILDEVKILK